MQKRLSIIACEVLFTSKILPGMMRTGMYVYTMTMAPLIVLESLCKTIDKYNW